MIVVPLLDKDPTTGERIDYRAAVARASRTIARQVRGRSGRRRSACTHRLRQDRRRPDRRPVQVMLFFGSPRADRHRDRLLLHALRAQHRAGGRLLAGRGGVAAGPGAALGFELDPYSILVPFLVFAIGMSHGAQKMNGIMQDIGRGAHKLVAARFTFRRLFLAGLTALLADAVGFAVLMVIDIPVIRELALTASIGVAVLIFTNLILLPVLLSYIGVSAAAAQRSLRAECERTSGAPARRLGAARPLHRAALGRWSRSASAAVLTVAGYRGQHAAEDRRPRSGRARTARRLALQPRQRLHHRQLRAVERPVRGDGEDRQGRLPRSTQTLVEADRLALGAAAGARRADHACRSPTRCARSPPAPTRATRSG